MMVNCFFNHWLVDGRSFFRNPLVMTNKAMEGMALIEIDDLPIKMVIFNSYVSLPEGYVKTVKFPMNSMVDLSIVFCKKLPESNICFGLMSRVAWDKWFMVTIMNGIFSWDYNAYIIPILINSHYPLVMSK